MKKRLLMILAALAVLFAACSDEETPLPGGEPAPVIDVPEGANPGEMLVKFKPEAAPLLSWLTTRAGGSILTRSGIPGVDVVLERIGTYKLERVFPVDARTEQRSAEAGLTLWYVIHFDGQTDLAQAARDLAQVADVAKVQYNRPIQRAYDPSRKPAILAGGRNRMVRASALAAGNAHFNDPGLALQWSYINDGSALQPGELNERGEEIVAAVSGVDVNCLEAWKRCTGDPSIIVAVLDEGVMWSHPDLKDNMWVNEAETYASKEDADGNGYAGDRYGYNFVSDMGFISFDGSTDTGHGTHVAGTIAAVNGNRVGVCGIAGGDGTPNSGVKIMSCQIFSGDYGSNFYQEARAIKYAADNGAVILQCSWGYDSGLSSPLTNVPGYTTDEEWIKACPLEKEALDYFIHNAGSANGVIDGGIVIFAGGNENSAMASYPSAYPDYISVSAVAADGTPASYTNYGPGIQIAAPGGDSFYHKTDKGIIYSTIPPLEGELYGYMEGTSMACPHVSGVVALGLSHAAKLHRHFRADEFRELILQSVNPVEPYFPDTKVYYDKYSLYGSISPVLMELSSYRGKMGSGLIDADKLLDAIEANGVEMTVPNLYVAVNGMAKINYSKYFKNGEQMTFACTVEDGAVAAMSTEDRVNFILKGLKEGSTKAVVTASDGSKKEFYITVRKNNGWL